MSRLLEIQEKIWDIVAEIEKTERNLISYPESSSLRIIAESLEKRRKRLEDEFNLITDYVGNDICSYRLITGVEGTPILALSEILGNFQHLFSLVYDALKHGPKQRERTSAESLKDSTLDFGYAYPGSLGFVLTIPNERLIIGETIIDNSAETVSQLIQSNSIDEIVKHVDKLGVAPVARMGEWIDCHLRAGLDADIEWRRGSEIRSKTLIQKPHLRSLRELLDETGEGIEEDIELIGKLVGIDVVTRTFHMEFEECEDIRGRLAESFVGADLFSVPFFYKANIKKLSTINKTTRKPGITYTLHNIEPHNN